MTNTVMLLYRVLLLMSAQAIRASLLASPHSGNRSMLAMVHLRDSLFALVTLVFYATEDSSGTMNQQRALKGIAALANPQQSNPGFPLSWHQSQPSCEVSSGSEVLRLTHLRNLGI